MLTQNLMMWNVLYFWWKVSIKLFKTCQLFWMIKTKRNLLELCKSWDLTTLFLCFIRCHQIMRERWIYSIPHQLFNVYMGISLKCSLYNLTLIICRQSQKRNRWLKLLSPFRKLTRNSKGKNKYIVSFVQSVSTLCKPKKPQLKL